MPKQDPQEQAALSVQDRATQTFEDENPLVFYISRVADEIPSYWSRQRDLALGKFWPTEPYLAGAVYSMCAKVAALDFKLIGPPKTRQRYKWVLLSADFGQGWVNFIPKVTQDLLTQDNGGFIELMRRKEDNDNPRSPVQAIAQLDSQRCRRTGSPEEPVGYTRMLKGAKEVPLKWWQVIAMADLPSPREELNGVGFCAVSRVLRAAQILRDIGLFKRQKLAGKRIPAILFVQGMRRNAVQQAITKAKEEQMSRGESHYSSPVVVASPDPSRMGLDAKLVELAGLPDGYDEDTTLKWYIAALAMGFGTDYTEFAPLPGGGLGTATQSTEMAARSRGKGPGIVLQQFEFAMNWNVLPESLMFQFASTDPLAEQERVNLRWQRARERQLRVQSQELTPMQALELAVEEGDAPERFLASEDGTPLLQDQRLEEMIKNVGEMTDVFKRAEMAYLRKYNERPALINGSTGQVINA